MIYGNTGAGLVDVDVPQSPLYQQALPNLRDVSAAAWGLPSLDDISVPDVTTEKDIQTDTDLTQKYFDLATKLKDYAVKGRSVGIDVTKPKNNPTHLQFSQEWNKMYQEFLQTGKELKNAKANIGVYNKAVTNPNAIVAPLEKGQVVTDDYLNQRSIETPFSNAKMLVKGYQSLKPIFDQNTFAQFQDKWIGDMDMIDQESEQMKAQKPELADQIDAYAEQVKAQMFPPQMDYALKAKLAQAYKIHKDNLAPKWYNAQTAREGLEFRKSQQEVAGSQFADVVMQLANSNGVLFDGTFGEFKNDGFGDKYVPKKARTATVKELKEKGVKFLKNPDGSKTDINKVNENSKYILIVGDDNTVETTYPTSQEGLDAFSAKYQQPFKRREEQAKSQIGTYDYQLDDYGNIQLIPNQQEVKVSTKTTNTQSEKATTTKKTKEYKAKTTVKSR